MCIYIYIYIYLYHVRYTTLAKKQLNQDFERYLASSSSENSQGTLQQHHPQRIGALGVSVQRGAAEMLGRLGVALRTPEPQAAVVAAATLGLGTAVMAENSM